MLGSKVPPSRRTPTRLSSLVIRHGWRIRHWVPPMNQSCWGPSRSAPGPGRAAWRGVVGDEGGSGIGSDGEGRTGGERRGSDPTRVSWLRDPSTQSTAMPPRTARYAHTEPGRRRCGYGRRRRASGGSRRCWRRRPLGAAPRRSVLPSSRSSPRRADCRRAGSPGRGCVDRRRHLSGPPDERAPHARGPAPWWRNRPARCAARVRSSCRYPPEANGLARTEQGRWVALGVPHRSRRASDQIPPAWRR